ncbi:ATP-binding protein [Quadrisphaera sp. INWT6]|uniref:ATP-binding protein n=1 Tax=Quadrisphaera sp. INWT6 TaxID=2596917 RepID=UPI0018928107|nr:ATP-binding protein [Quadrisphaera sp. INWT6]MBF5083169.1 sensor histidine kinase [Quadrisphaera sp. INWT6]
MVRNLSIRSRILAVLALPVLVLVAASAVLSWSSWTTVREAGQLQRAVDAARSLPALVTALDDERTASVALLSGDASAAEGVAQARATTDPLLQTVTDELAAVDTSRLSGEAAQGIAAAVRTQSQVATVRSVVDEGRQSATSASARYSTVISAQAALPEALAADADPASGTPDALRAATSLQQLVGLLADERDVGARALQSGGGVNSAERASLVGVAARIASTRADAVRLGRGAGVQVPPPGVEVVQLRAAVEGDPGAGFAQPSVATWRAALDAEVDALAPSAAALAAAGADGVAQQVDSARTTAVAIALGGLAAVVLPLLFGLLIARGITQPLRALTRAAGDVRSRLPRLVEAAHSTSGAAAEDAELEPIPVRSRDEVGRLAAAFNDVNSTTVQVAREQAALRAAISSTFVTVARRDQALLNRQLAFIDTLERAEEDPRTLEDLFTLDHLATRMRRNAESLLVLAGIDGGRRLRAPMPLSDVVRTASSEIEDYRRIDLALGTDPAVLGHLALPAAHLVAELLENATRSSDPGTRVRVSTTQQSSGVQLTITDDGIGMSPAQLAEVTARLADPSASAAVGASELGYFVVGRIARRLGARVEVHAGAVRGTVVALSLPTAVFAGSVASVEPSAVAPVQALPVRGPATGALSALQLPPTRAAGPAPAEPLAPAPDRAAAAAAPAAAGAGSTPGGLPRRAPRSSGPAPALTAPVAATAVPVAAAPAEAAAAREDDPSVARRSAVFRTFTARRGELEPSGGPDSDAGAVVDLTAVPTPVLTRTGPPAQPLAVDLDAAAPYVPDRAPATGSTALPSRDDERVRGAHAAPKRGLLARLGRGETTSGQQAVVPAAAANTATGSATSPGAAATSEDADAAEVRPMTRRELRALEASGQLSAVRTGPRSAVRTTGRQAAVRASSDTAGAGQQAPAAAASTAPSTPSTPSPQPAREAAVATSPASAPPAAPPLAPGPVVAQPAASGRPTVPLGLRAPRAEPAFTPVPAASASPSALPRRSTPAAPAAASDDLGSTAERAAGWLAQPAAPLRPLPPMPAAPAAGGPGGRPLALAVFETGEIPREAYRPAAVSSGAAPLVRRTSGSALPTRPAGSPAVSRSAGGQHPPRRREPADVRTMLAGYTSGVSRARRAEQAHGQVPAQEPQEDR